MGSRAPTLEFLRLWGKASRCSLGPHPSTLRAIGEGSWRLSWVPRPHPGTLRAMVEGIWMLSWISAHSWRGQPGNTLEYGGATYSSCTAADHSELSCATSYHHGTRNANDWGKCNCQADPHGSWSLSIELALGPKLPHLLCTYYICYRYDKNKTTNKTHKKKCSSNNAFERN